MVRIRCQDAKARSVTALLCFSMGFSFTASSCCSIRNCDDYDVITAVPEENFTVNGGPPLSYFVQCQHSTIRSRASRLTGGEAGPLVTAGELDVEVGNKCVNVVVALHLQAERGGEGQVVRLHRVDVHLLHTKIRHHDTKKPKDAH